MRESEHAFVAEGVKVVGAALDAGAPVESLFVAAEGRDAPAVAALAERALAAGIRVYDLAPGVMERAVDTVTPQAVTAVVGAIDRPLGELLAPDEPERLLLVCVDVRDPGNLGSLVRSGAAAGAAGVVICAGTADPFNPKTVRASAGAIFHLPLARAASAAEAFDALRAAGYRLVATTAHEGTDYALAPLGGRLALVFGNEASGLPDAVVAAVDEQVTVPMREATESLNVAMTATILSFEVARRRRLR